MKTHPSERDIIKARQRAWATRKGLSVDRDGYCTCVNDNIFQGLSSAARKDFESGDGAELGGGGRRGKIQALHSSSALACNWFDFWRDRDLQPLSRAFGTPVPFSSLALEEQFPTGLGGIGPNLDVLLTCADGTLFAIESKFAEPYTKSKTKTYLKPKYFHDGRRLWTDAGLPGCQAVAEALRTGKHGFEILDVAQLLKHMLALAHSGQDWSLWCVWFEVAGALADRHRQELRDFAAEIGVDAAHFSSLRYQALLARMAPFLSENDSEYIAYLRDRYMSDAVVS